MGVILKVYLASSWKNKEYVDKTAAIFRKHGHEVDNFSDPSGGRYVFSWTELDPRILSNLNAKTFLNDVRTQKAFQEDKNRIEWADIVLMIMPCGRSSHLELGYAKGIGKRTIIYYPTGYTFGEFETMYGFADMITDSIYDVLYDMVIRN